MTDGAPTVGETRPFLIRRNINKITNGTEQGTSHQKNLLLLWTPSLRRRLV
jgi:hypothetical protein